MTLNYDITTQAIGNSSGFPPNVSGLIARYARTWSSIKDIYDPSYPSEDQASCVRIVLDSLATVVKNNPLMQTFAKTHFGPNQLLYAKSMLIGEWTASARKMMTPTQQQLSAFVKQLFLPVVRYKDGREVQVPLVVAIETRFDDLPITSLQDTLNTRIVTCNKPRLNVFNLDTLPADEVLLLTDKVDSHCYGQLTSSKAINLQFLFEFHCCRLAWVVLPNIGEELDKQEAREAHKTEMIQRFGTI